MLDTVQFKGAVAGQLPNGWAQASGPSPLSNTGQLQIADALSARLRAT